METYKEDGTTYKHPNDIDEVTLHEEKISKLKRRRHIIKITKVIILLALFILLFLRFIKL
jgi:hypothetical protein